MSTEYLIWQFCSFLTVHAEQKNHFGRYSAGVLWNLSKSIWHLIIWIFSYKRGHICIFKDTISLLTDNWQKRAQNVTDNWQMDILFNWQLIFASPLIDQLFTWDPHMYWVGQVVYPSEGFYNWCIWALETRVVVLLPELNSAASWDGLTAPLAFNVIYWLVCVLGYEDASRVTPAGICS